MTKSVSTILALLFADLALSAPSSAMECGPQNVQRATQTTFSSQTLTATLVGFDEFTQPSSPPRKYRRKRVSGELVLNETRIAFGAAAMPQQAICSATFGTGPVWSATGTLSPRGPGATPGSVRYLAVVEGTVTSGSDPVHAWIEAWGCDATVVAFAHGQEKELLFEHAPFNVRVLLMALGEPRGGAMHPMDLGLTKQTSDIWDVTQEVPGAPSNQSRRWGNFLDSAGLPVGPGNAVPAVPGFFSINGPAYGFGTQVDVTPARRTTTGTGSWFPMAPGSAQWVGNIVEELTLEDTEETAAAREQTIVGASTTAYRTNRGNGFTFSQCEVDFTARFKVCPPSPSGPPDTYNIYLVYSARPHGTFDVGARRRHCLGPREVRDAEFEVTGSVRVKKGEAPFSELDTDYTVIAIEAEKMCSATEPGGAGGGPGSAVYWFSLGRKDGGAPVGQLRLETDSLGAATYTPAALIASATTGSVEIVRDATGVIRQARAPETLADLVALNATAYEVRFFVPAQLGVKDPATGVYAVSGAPFVTYRVENPDGAQVPATRLRITEMRGAVSKVSEFVHDPAAATWTFSQGNGLRRESLTSADYGFTVRTTTIMDGDGRVVSKVDRYYQGELLTEEVFDPDGEALTTWYEYYGGDDPTDPNYGQLMLREGWKGDWEYYTYCADGVRQIFRPFGDGMTWVDIESWTRVTENDYGTIPDGDGDGVAERCVTTTERVVERGPPGRETARRYRIDWTAPVTIGGVNCKRRSDIVCVAPGAVWNAAANLVTETSTYASGPFAGRTRCVVNSDGTAMLTGYTLDANGRIGTVSDSGRLNAARDAIVEGTRTVTFTSAAGRVTAESVSDIASGLTISSWAATQFDSLNRPTRLDYTDGTFVTRDYACCGLAAERDRTGVVTTYGYDALGRQTAVTRAGITTRTAFDAAGRVTANTRVGSDNTEKVQSTNTYDLAGRLIAERDALNRLTTTTDGYDPDWGFPMRTVNAPDGGTRVETYTPSGELLSVNGTAAAARAYEHGIDATGLFTREIKVGSDANGEPVSTEWIQSYTDFAGRPLKTVYADGAEARSFYNAAGQLVREVDPDGVITLYGYDARGRRNVTAIDINRNGVIDYAGPDRITRALSEVALRDGIVVQRTTTQVWATDNQDAPTTVAVSEQSTDGLRSWQTVNGLTTATVVVPDGVGGRTVTTTAPDGTQTVQTYAGDRLLSTIVKTGAGTQLSATTYAYDSHGRLRSSTDGRNGTTTYTYFDDDRLRTVTTPDPDPARSGNGYDPQVTSYTYDVAGRVSAVTQPDGGIVNTIYYPTGAVKRTWGARTYPVEYTYDTQGRLKTLATWQNFAGDSGRAVTTWNYDPVRGWLLNKRYADNTGPSYIYTPAGRLKTRTWARSPAVTTTYNYGAGGDLTLTDYSDATPDVTLTYDRQGRPATITDGSGTRMLVYHASGQLQDETYTAGLLNGLAVNRSFDSLARLGSTSALSASSVLSQIAYSYDAASRLGAVIAGPNTAAYSYVPNSPLVQSVAFVNSGSPRLMSTRTYDNLNRLISVSSAPSASSVLNHAYTYNAVNQRTRATREDNASWTYAYDALGQVTDGTKRLADGTPVPGHAFAWTYDDIGNRRTATTNGNASAYTVNPLNQYGQRTVPGVVDVLGAAKADATVTVTYPASGGAVLPTQRQGELFHRQLAVDNTAAAQYPSFKVTGVKNLVGPNGEDAVTELTRSAYVPRTPEAFTHDADGNLTADARWTYSWDAENRLVAVESAAAALAAGVPRQKLEFAYDGQSRRVAKKVFSWNPASGLWNLISDFRFLFDGWNLLAEFGVSASSPLTFTLTRSFVWGLDLSGSFQGAGGVGGLLFATNHTLPPAPSSLLPCFDGNGNVTGAVNAADGTVAARYDYTAFGETLVADGAAATALPFRFSTKFTDDETGLLYYGYRYYSPPTGRWPSRDSIAEDGGPNLYGLVGNDSLSDIDALGEKAYLMYRKLNISLLNKTFPIAGHVYLLLDEEGMGAAWRGVKTASGYSFGRPITMSFHPYAVWASLHPSVAAQDKKTGRNKQNRFSVFVTDGSSVVINDPEDFKLGTDRKLITDNECEQIKLFEVALMSAVLNNFGIPDPAKYSFASSNCAHWADAMVRRAGLRSPGLGAWNLGAGNYASPVGAVGYGMTFIGKTVFNAIDFLKDRPKK
jgi:RHS repeat-associated protein